MKRFCIFWVAAVLALLALTGCSGDNEPIPTTGSVPDKHYTEEILPVDGIRIEIVEGTVSPTSVKVAYINENECTYTYGEGFSLQKQVDGQWYTMSVINENTGFLAIGYTLKPGRVEKEYSWRLMHGEMGPGQYRIVTDVFPQNGASYDNKILLVAPFTIE